MNTKRLELHEMLCDILGSRNVYFQTPESIKMKYPAIRYSRNSIDNTYADDTVYGQRVTYTITVIDSDPDSEIVSKVSKIPTIKFDRHYTSDNLNHDVFTLIY